MPTIMIEMCKSHPINPEWRNYYLLLEGIRLSGICNMYGAHPYLAELADISSALAKDILCSWIENYSELKELYWPEQKVYVNLKDLVED
jgi:hypothetical protein